MLYTVSLPTDFSSSQVLSMTRWITRSLAAAAVMAAAIGFASGQQTPKKKAEAKAPKPPRATPADSLKVAKGFKAELLYAVPQDQFGSWVNMCVDPKGRLIVSDQYGPLYRITPQAIGTDVSVPPKIEKIPADIGEAQGLLWAFDSLYVMVNSSKRPSGLYRVTSSKHDDTLDTVQLLKGMNGGGEHGPHAIVKHPDGKRLTVVCGNQTKMVDYTSTKVPPIWGEDHLLPRMPDGRGFMKGVMGPGGCIYNVTPDGKEWELFSVGYRNPFDIAYDKQGNLFTYDADMEWDFNTPWYRPTRVCEVTSGSEFGWRNGAGKFPAYYEDTVPAVLDIGPGSPTGVCFGYGAKFPAKYENAFFMCDWSYGILYAVHMKPKGSVHELEKEDFVSGTPLPLTDVVINPVDGALYFTIGGRKTQSALYRVTAEKSTITTEGDVVIAGDPIDIVRKKPKIGVEASLSPREICEQFHGKQDPKAIDAVWPYLKNEDRFIRAAARAAIEFQPYAEWQAKALAETDPQTAITALIALTRASATCPFHLKPTSAKADPKLGEAILAKLNSIDFAKLSTEQRLGLIRVYHILYNRYGPPNAAGREATLKKFEPAFPTKDRFVDGELCQVLVYLQSPVAAAKTVAILLTAPTQEEQIEYARALRVLKAGWTPELRKEYFTWIQKADGFRGGNSFGGFLKQIKDDAVATLTPTEVAMLKPLLETKTKPGSTVLPQRPLVKEYKFAELLPIVEKGVKSGRDYERGRKMFAEARCAACHRFDNEGGIAGPDLTQAAGRFSTKDLLENILDPNKEISDQYAAVEIETEDGRKIIGRIVNHSGDGMTVNTNMLDPNANVGVKQSNILSIKTSKQSPMPFGTLDTLKEDEVLDLMAYLLSRGTAGTPCSISDIGH